MSNKKIKLIAISIAMVLSTQIVLAEDLINDFGGLTDALKNATGSSVTVKLGSDISATARITIGTDTPKSVTILGEDKNYKSTTLAFDVKNNTELTLNNITLDRIQHDSSWGGAMYNSGKLTLDNVTFNNNIARTKNAVGGGAMALVSIGRNPVNTTIKNSTFTNNSTETRNSAKNNGGAIYVYGTSRDNAGDNTLNISDSHFESNHTNKTGGAIGVNNQGPSNFKIEIKDTTFTKNNSTGYGGAIDVTTGGTGNVTLKLDNATFNGNYSESAGGAIAYEQGNITSNIINSTFTNNTANNGGAIYNGIKNLEISNTIFDGNKTNDGGKGGAIYNAGNISLNQTEFKQSTDTIYMANDSFADFSGTNILNGSISSENTNSTIINNGILNLNSDNSGYNGKYTQNSGITNVTGTFFDGNSEIQAGTLNWLTQNTTSGKLNVLGNSNLNIGNSTIKGELDLGTGSSIAESAKVFINTNSILNLKNNSTVTLDSTDTWGGKINLQDSANLTLNNVTNYSGAVLNATGGTLNINNMNLNIGTNSFIDKNVSTNINSNATLSVNTGGNVTLGSTSNWIGKVIVNGGDFTTDGITSNGIIQAGSGNITIQNGNLSVKENSIINNAVKLSIKSTGILDIQGGTITIGNDDNWAGKINLGSSNQGGTLNYGTTNSGTLKAESGNLNLLSNSVLNIQSPSQVDKKVVVNIQNGATVNIKTGAIFNLDSLDKWNGLVSVSNGVLKTDSVDNTKIGGKLQQTSGSSIFDNKSNILLDGQENYINGGDVSILNGSSLHLGNKVTTFVLDNLNMDGKSLFNTINNTVNKYGTIDNINIDGTNNISIDVSGRNWKSDTFIINNLNGTNNGTLNISNFNFVGLAPIDRNIKLQIFDAQNINNINFTASDKKIFTPIGNYQIFSQGGGAYNASLVDYNPQVYRGQVATLAAYNHQLLINDMLTNHFILPNERLIDKAVQANKTSSISPLFTPYQSTIDNGGIWTKNYVSFETLSMTNNLKVGNNVYGTLIGADFPSIKLKKGWKYIPTAYIGYNGGMQGFNNVDMYQNGGQGGFMGTFIKNNFIGSITAYGGGYFNEMSVAGNTDRTGNWFAGTAAKVAYNIRATKHFIVQPTAFISYNIFGKQNWGTNYGSMSMNSGTLNGINVAPGMNLIYSRDTWSVYGTIQYMFNINDQVGGKAGNVNLPKTEMRHGYINYGIGATKTWKERLTSYFQINFRNGGRTGVGFQLGLNYLFDWGKPKNKTISQTTPIKPEKRVLKAGK